MTRIVVFDRWLAVGGNENVPDMCDIMLDWIANQKRSSDPI